MNENEALKKFVDDNFDFLTSKEFNRKNFKKIRKTFFIDKHNKKYGIPKIKRVCEALCQHMIKNGIKSARIQKYIEDLPVFKETGEGVRDDLIAMASAGSIKSDISEKDLEVIKSANAFRAVERNKGQEIEKNALETRKELEREIEQKKKEYERLPSILDDHDFEEPEEPKRKEKSTEWWEDLGLFQDPFPGGLDGFRSVEKKFHDDIIVETEPIKWMLNKLKQDEIDIFGKGYLVAGEFGTGKTTFYDFLAPRMTAKHIEPSIILLQDKPTKSTYIQSFEHDFCYEVYKLAKRIGSPTTTPIREITDARITLMEIQEKKNVRGFLFFIDELHKHENLNLVFDFLASLQATKNVLARDGINATFFVAGFPDWEENIRNNSQLSGFFDSDKTLTMPPVTPPLAALTIKRRLHTFSINPETSLQISKQFLQSIFTKEKQDRGGENIGFRPYIRKTIETLKAKQFNILDIDYTKIKSDTIKEIRETLESDPRFKKCINGLLYGGGIKKKGVRVQSLKILCRIFIEHEQDGISEDDKIFRSHKFIFKQLKKHDLITKFDQNGSLVWKVNRLLRELNNEILEEHSLSIEHYLLPCYSSTKPNQSKTSVKNDKIKRFRKDIADSKNILSENLLKNLNFALELYEKNIFPFTDLGQLELEDIDRKHVNQMEICIRKMMETLLQFESPALLDVAGTDIKGAWKLRHSQLESPNNLLTLMSEKQDNVHFARCFRHSSESFDEIWQEFRKSSFFYTKSKIKPTQLPESFLHTIWDNLNPFFTGSGEQTRHFDAVKTVVEGVEVLIRNYLHISSLLIFGPYHERLKYHPKSTKKYIERDCPNDLLSYESLNEYQNLNRKQYRQLFCEYNKKEMFSKYIIKPVISTWDSNDLEVFFKIFGDINIATSHEKRDDAIKHDADLETFFRLFCRLTKDMAQYLYELIMEKNMIIKGETETHVVFGYVQKRQGDNPRLCSPEEKIPKYLHRYALPEKNYNLFDQTHSKYGDLEIDIFNVDKTNIDASEDFSKVVAELAYLHYTDKIRIIRRYGTILNIERI